MPSRVEIAIPRPNRGQGRVIGRSLHVIVYNIPYRCAPCIALYTLDTLSSRALGKGILHTMHCLPRLHRPLERVRRASKCILHTTHVTKTVFCSLITPHECIFTLCQGVIRNQCPKNRSRPVHFLTPGPFCG